MMARRERMALAPHRTMGSLPSRSPIRPMSYPFPPPSARTPPPQPGLVRGRRRLRDRHQGRRARRSPQEGRHRQGEEGRHRQGPVWQVSARLALGVPSVPAAPARRLPTPPRARPHFPGRRRAAGGRAPFLSCLHRPSLPPWDGGALAGPRHLGLGPLTGGKGPHPPGPRSLPHPRRRGLLLFTRSRFFSACLESNVSCKGACATGSRRADSRDGNRERRAEQRQARAGRARLERGGGHVQGGATRQRGGEEGERGAALHRACSRRVRHALAEAV
jgi:hypothetical protein